MQACRRMGGEQRIALTAEMYGDGVAIMRDLILDRYPDISADELERQMRRRLLPRELALQVERYLEARADQLNVADLLARIRAEASCPPQEER